MQVSQEFITESRKFLTEQFFPRIERVVENLSDEQIWQRPNEASNSIGNLMLHLAGNVRQWIISGLGGQEDNRVRQQEFDERSTIPKNELLAKLWQTVTEADAVLEKFDEAKLLETRKIQHDQVTPLYAIYHVVEHFSMHTGQIIFISKMLTAEDLEFYKWQQEKPLRNW